MAVISRDDLIKEFCAWSQKEENFKKGYKGIITEKNLLRWDDSFFGAQLFDMKNLSSDEFISKVKDLVYTNKDPQWKKTNDNISSGAPQAILGTNNYLKFLKERFQAVKPVNYFIFNTKEEKKKILDGNKIIEYDGIYWYHDEIKKGDIVLFNQAKLEGGEAGFFGILEISSEPYSVGYAKTAKGEKYYKIKAKPLIIFPKPLSRKDFSGYDGTIDIPYICLKSFPNEAFQAIYKLKDDVLDKLPALVQALADIFPVLRDDLTSVFGKSILANKEGSKNTKTAKQSNLNFNVPSIDPNPIIDQPYNLIVYGAPGTGKSYSLNERVKKYFRSEKLRTRVTFHPNYTYKNFVGSYKPSPLYKSTQNDVYLAMDSSEAFTNGKEPMIEYVFEPGPFIKMFLLARNNPNHNFVIVIEELNRANAPSVFGEVFQLLDRESNGESTYSVRLEEPAMKFLNVNGIADNEIKLPKNLYIWSTMNNADQGVLPLDTAFKRRWEFEHMGLDQNQEEILDWEIKFPFIPETKKILWNDFRCHLNDFLSDNLGVHEDKLIAPFFMRKEQLTKAESINNKLILYLSEDVLKYKKGLFTEKTFTKICDVSSKKNGGEKVFVESFKITDLLKDR